MSEKNYLPVPEYYPFTNWYPDRNGEVVFVNKETGERKTIIDGGGKIVNFPGIIKDESWTRYLTSDGNINPYNNYRIDFEVFDEEKYIMLWVVQPDGRYWADDDGYGMTSDVEICLYAFIDKSGDFMGPFRVYKVGKTRYLERPRCKSRFEV